MTVTIVHTCIFNLQLSLNAYSYKIEIHILIPYMYRISESYPVQTTEVLLFLTESIYSTDP